MVLQAGGLRDERAAHSACGKSAPPRTSLPRLRRRRGGASARAEQLDGARDACRVGGMRGLADSNNDAGSQVHNTSVTQYADIDRQAGSAAAGESSPAQLSVMLILYLLIM